MSARGRIFGAWLLSLALVTAAAAAPARRASSRPAASQPAVVYKYLKATPEQDAAAIARARTNATKLQDELKLELREIQTEHFLIFTDWPANSDYYLKTSLEAAYSAVARYFEIPPRENIFVGKLPVFMFDKQQDFLRYARQWDELTLPDTVAGYYAGRTDGLGHMAMWRPMPDPAHGVTAKAAQLRWAYTLVHEFTHAFVARYRTNAIIPMWVNEGLAEVLAQAQFPRKQTRVAARGRAEHKKELADIFDEDGFKGGDDYPVMQTLVEYLLFKNRREFIPFINSMKDGTDPEEALQKHYGLTYETLEEQWRRDLQRR